MTPERIIHTERLPATIRHLNDISAKLEARADHCDLDIRVRQEGELLVFYVPATDAPESPCLL
jgi:hypothetical protein